MESRVDCYVAGVLADMLRISRLGGLAPLRFAKKGSGWRVSISPWWSCYGYIVVTIIIVTTVASVIIDLLQKSEQSLRMASSTRRIVWMVDVTCMLTIAATIVYGAPGQMRAMFLYLNRIEKINLELNMRDWPMYNENKKKCFFIFWISLTIVLTSVDYFMLIATTPKNQFLKWFIVLSPTYYFCYWILQLRQITLASITLHVMHSFRSVNDSLKTLPSKCLQKNRSNPATVRRLALAYASTCDVVRHVDRAHGPIVLLMFGSFLLHLVCTPYYVITSILFESNYVKGAVWAKLSIYVMVQLVWCVFHIVSVMMVIEPCHSTLMEMKTTSELVSNLLHSTDSTYDPLAMELENFMKYLFINKASYSAMQVITISRPLLATILGSITTYLVIVIQLQQN